MPHGNALLLLAGQLQHGLGLGQLGGSVST